MDKEVHKKTLLVDMSDRPPPLAEQTEIYFFVFHVYITRNTMPFIFVYRTADIIALSRSFDSAEVYISCSIQKGEWLSIIA